MPDSTLPGFYRLSLSKRLQHLSEILELSEEELSILSGEGGLCAEQADHMVENALGVLSVPMGLCANLQVDGLDRLVPMTIEEPSVVAAASHAAKLLRAGGGIKTEVSPPHMIGQIQLLDIEDARSAEQAINDAREEIVAMANGCDPCLVSLGGGVRDLEVRHIPPLEKDDPVGPMLVVHLIVDVREAMGANAINTMCEHVAPRLEQLTGGRALLRILSNLADRRTVVASGTVPLEALEGKGCSSPEALARGIEAASVLAERDPYRAATHNKGIMNGIDAVLLAFGQDWRAVEAGAHAFAARGGRYTALARWRFSDAGLTGRLELPLSVGLVGGVTKVHPTVKVAARIAQVSTTAELTSIAAAVGLAQNLGALRALAAEGIQRGHMAVHARNVAVAAGAVNREVDRVASILSSHGRTDPAQASRVLRNLRMQARLPGGDFNIRRRFQTLRETYWPRIWGLIQDVLRDSNNDNTSLAEMCTYHLESGGKRLRAMLPLLVAEALGTDPEQLLPFAASCEMLHNGTLVHNDLQDGDQIRRGRETVWRRYGINQAINLGDAMMYYTLQLLDRLNVPTSRRSGAIREVLRETLRVIDGQDRDFKLKQLECPSLEDYFTMVQGKTSGLFALPMAGAAILCGAPTPMVEGLQEAARHMGVLFQIQDDVLDLYGDKGRDMQGSDICEGKRSVLAVHALHHASVQEASWIRETLDKDRAETTDKDISDAAELFRRTGSLAFALQEIEDRKQHAVSVGQLADNPQLQFVIESMCELFQVPLKPVIKALAEEKLGTSPAVSVADRGALASRQ